jgi:hypothetical protein
MSGCGAMGVVEYARPWPRVVGSSPAQARGGGEIVNIRCTNRTLTTLSSGIWLNVPMVITLSVDPLLCVAVDSPVRTVRQCCIRWGEQRQSGVFGHFLTACSHLLDSRNCGGSPSWRPEPSNGGST